MHSGQSDRVLVVGLVATGQVAGFDEHRPPVILSRIAGGGAGLERIVTIVSSNDGKCRGWIWPQLLSKFAIGQHFGDNVHSDGQTAAAAGLKAIIYTGARRSQIEELLVDHGFGSLADLVREVRLGNPFPDSRPQERYLWLLACQLNFPLLVFASLWLERHAENGGAGELLFVSRDCLLWHRLHQQLFPQRRVAYLYTSRKCLLKPSENYLEYFRSAWHPDSVIVDLFSTGTSWSRLFARLGSRGRCFFIGHVDNYSYLQDSVRPEDWLDMNTVFRNSELGSPLNKGVEMLNYAPHPVVDDVLLLPGDVPLPVLADALEYDPALPEAAHLSFKTCVQRLVRYPDVPRSSSHSLGELIRSFVHFICSESRLSSIYTGHQAADMAYLQSILG